MLIVVFFFVIRQHQHKKIHDTKVSQVYSVWRIQTKTWRKPHTLQESGFFLLCNNLVWSFAVWTWSHGPEKIGATLQHCWMKYPSWDSYSGPLFVDALPAFLWHHTFGERDRPLKDGKKRKKKSVKLKKKKTELCIILLMAVYKV